MKKLIPFGVITALVISVAGAPATARPSENKNIVQTAQAAGNFKTLTKLVTKAGLAATLSQPGPYTVFAPTDAAFQATLGVDASTVCTIPQDLLTTVLLYHVTEGRRFSNSVVPKGPQPKTIETLAQIPFQVEGDLDIIDGNDTTEPSIVAANLNASNGVIHVIDEVLLPVNL